MIDERKVSVIIPTYKRPDKLKNAVDSVLSQDYPNIEVIVVDDNNPEDPARKKTELIMDQYKSDLRVKYIKHPRNLNGSAARNTGFRESCGGYIMFLDDDDEFMPGKISSQYNCLSKKDETWGVCYTQYVLRNMNGKFMRRSIEKREGILFLEELKRNLYVGAGSNLMLRRSVVEDIGGFDESFARNQDQEFLTRILFKYKIAYVPINGLIANVHEKTDYSNVDFDKLTEQYLQTFKDKFDLLSEKQRKEVLTVINLQRLRVKVLNKKDFVGGLHIIRECKLNMKLLLRYLYYLAFRKITKTNFGFDYKEK